MSSRNEKLAKMEYRKHSKTKIKIIRLKEVIDGTHYYYIEDEYGEEFLIEIYSD